jgi:X-X-X-Leu-X-X-Gly heptad repeat protein
MGNDLSKQRLEALTDRDLKLLSQRLLKDLHHNVSGNVDLTRSFCEFFKNADLETLPDKTLKQLAEGAVKLAEGAVKLYGEGSYLGTEAFMNPFR